MNINKEKIFYFVKEYWPIWLILIIGFTFRAIGVYFDYPDTTAFIWDESYNIAYLIDVLEQKRLIVDPASSIYPTFLPFLLAPTFCFRILYLAWQNSLHSVGEIKDFLIGNGLGQIYIIARWYSVFFGTATIYLIYKIFRIIFIKKLSAYYAGLAYAVSLLPVFISHWGKHHAVLVFFILLSLYFSLKFEETKKTKNFYLTVLSSALAFSVHYIGISAVIFPALAWWQNKKDISVKIFFQSSAIYGVIIICFYGANFFGFIHMIKEMINAYYIPNGGAIVPTGKLERFYYTFRDSFNIEPVFISLFFLMLIARFKAWRQDRLIRYVLFGMIFYYFLMITIIVGPHISRWLLVFISLAVPLVAAALVEFFYEKKVNTFIVSAILSLLIIPNMFFSWHWVNMVNNFTSLEASDWIIKNSKKEDIVYCFSESFRLPYSYEAAVWNYEHNAKHKLQRKVKYIIDHPEKFKGTGSNIMYDNNNHRYKDLAGESTKYVIISFGKVQERDLIVDNLKKYHSLELLEKFYPTTDQKVLAEGLDNDYINSPEKITTLLKLEKTGHFFEIYKINKY